MLTLQAVDGKYNISTYHLPKPMQMLLSWRLTRMNQTFDSEEIQKIEGIPDGKAKKSSMQIVMVLMRFRCYWSKMSRMTPRPLLSVATLRFHSMLAASGETKISPTR